MKNDGGGGNAMSEKEFITKIIHKWLPEDGDGYSDNDIEYFVNNFLEEHHKTYYEVEFIKKLKSDYIDPNGSVYRMGVDVAEGKDKTVYNIIDDDYDYAADDMNYDAARERKYK